MERAAGAATQPRAQGGTEDAWQLGKAEARGDPVAGMRHLKPLEGVRRQLDHLDLRMC